MGGVRAADLPPHRGAAGRLRRRSRGCRRRRYSRHLGGSRPRHDHRLGRGARGSGRAAQPADRRRGAWLRGGHGPLAGGRGPVRRCRPRHGWRPLLPDRRAAAGTPGGPMTLTYAAAHDLLEAYDEARMTYDGDAFTALFADEAELTLDPFAPPLAG